MALPSCMTNCHTWLAVILFTSGQLWLTFIVTIVMIVVVLSWHGKNDMFSTVKFTPPLYITLWCPVTVSQTTETQLILLNWIYHLLKFVFQNCLHLYKGRLPLQKTRVLVGYMCVFDLHAYATAAAAVVRLLTCKNWSHSLTLVPGIQFNSIQFISCSLDPKGL